jgi:hypothetical protein
MGRGVRELLSASNGKGSELLSASNGKGSA